MAHLYIFLFTLFFASSCIANETETTKKSNEELISTLQQLLTTLTKSEEHDRDHDYNLIGKANKDIDKVNKNTKPTRTIVDIDVNVPENILNANIPHANITRQPFTASINVNTGAPSTNNTLSFVINGTEAMNIDGSSNVNITAGGFNMLNQQPIILQDSTEGNYVGINAPTEVIASYTLSLPNTAPTVRQSLRAGSAIPTQLTWLLAGGSELPSASYTIYVAKYGNDTTGNGSFDLPYASLSKAITVANGIASDSNPIAICISPGIYIEDNSAAPLTISVDGISIIGVSSSSVAIIPNTPTNNLLLINNPAQIANITFESSAPSATAIMIDAGGSPIFDNIQVYNFLTGIDCNGTDTSFSIFSNSFFVNNGTALSINNGSVECISSVFFGPAAANDTPANTGIAIAGVNASVALDNSLILSCTTGVNANNNSKTCLNNAGLRYNINDIVQSGAAYLSIVGSTFELTSGASDIKFQVSGAGTIAEIVSCDFSGKSSLGTTQGTAIIVTDNAFVRVSGGSMYNYTNGIEVGTSSDTSSTSFSASSLFISNCTNDIIQQGSSTLNLNAIISSSSKINISNSTNVMLAYFDLDNNNALTIGTTANVDLDLLQASISNTPANNPNLNYLSSLYSTQAIGITNPVANPSTSFIISNADANLTAVTTDRAKPASINLFSDEGSPVGGTSALRGWEMQKTGTAASLAFNYQNSDTIGQSAVSAFTVMQLNGVSNQLQLPTAGTQIVFDSDTNLYRSGASVLQTDSNFIVGTLTPGYVVTTNATTNQLASSITTDTELSYLSGTTSNIQTQLNSKVNKAGDTMTGTLQLPAGSATSPSLIFTGSTSSGLSADMGNLIFSTTITTTSGAGSMTIGSDGVVTIPSLSPTGVVHNDAFGNLSSSLIVNADISSSAAITDSKLATISTAGKVANSATTATSTNTASTIVARDASGNFSAGTITANLTGNVTGSASLNVLKAGDTMTGTLTMPAGTAASPSIQFTGSTNTGISSPVMNTLSFDTNGAEAMNINATGGVTIDGFATAGVVHNSSAGLLSSSLIVNADITPGTITNASLATISSSNVPSNIVVRDGSGNFSTNEITILGTVTNPTDAATKAYVDSVAATGLVAKTPAVVVSTTDVSLSGLQTIDGVTLIANDRVLLVGQTDEVDNGLWLAQTGAWTYPTDWAVGTTADLAYVLILSGDDYAGSSWLCNTPDAIIGTDPITFAEFSLPSQTTGANVGSGTGLVYLNTTGLTLNFRSLLDGQHVDITTNADDITIATDATNANTPSTIVARDASGNFSAGTITAALIGSASLNVLKAGDSMSGGLNMLYQQPVIFQDSTAGNYVGINAPTDVTASYTLSLPTTAPTASQSLRAGSVTPTQLNWISAGGSELPANSYMIYVTKYGNDTTGNGSFDLPYATLAKAIDVANGIASASTPVAISVSPGTYTENNSSGPLAITVAGVSIVGTSPDAVVLIPSTPANNFLLVNDTTYIDSAMFMSLVPTATGVGITLTSGDFSILNNLQIVNFGTGIECSGTTSNYLCENCIFSNNQTGLFINNTAVEVNGCSIIGGESLYGTPANTGLSITGSVSACAMSGGVVASCITGLDVGNNSLLTASAVTFKVNVADVIQTDASHMTLSACTFAITTTTTDVDIQISGAGTYAEIVGCQFNGLSIDSVPQATALYLSDGATLGLNGGGMKYYTTAIQLGASIDTSTTQLTVSGFDIENCTNDIVQQGSTYLNFNAGTASSSKISINNPTNVNLAFFDLDNNNALTVGTTANANLDLLQAAISTNPANNPNLNYHSSLYSTQAIGITNPTSNPLSSFVISNDDANFTAVTTDRNNAASINLFSDEGSSVGGTTALRGWELQKTYTTASLAFNYQNSDTVGQGAVAEYTVMQLNGVSNQVQLPTAGTQIVFGGDTNLYRGGADILQTDSNVVIGTLSPGYVVTTASGTNELTSSITTDTEVSYLSGTTSSVQAQIDGKVAKAGDTMTGTLQLPAGTTSAPSLVFTGSTTSGLSANAGNLSFSTDGAESMKISSAGVVSIDGFTAAGVVHNDTSGDLSSSLIINADISSSAGITDSKLATIISAGKVANSATTATSADTASAIVARDSSGNFSAGTITASLNGNATTATTSTNFSGSLSGEVTGTQTTTYVSAAVSTDTANSIVRRDASGNFTTHTISLDGNLTLDETTSSSIGNITKGANSFIHNYGTNNTFVGETAGNFVMTGTSNTAFGYGALPANATGTGNNAFGYEALAANTTGSGNTASGFQALSLMTTGTNNIAVGSLAGSAMTSSESSNIDIGNVGVVGDNGAIRIGTAGIHTTNFQAGVYNVSLGSTLPVVISSSGQLGTGSNEGSNYTAIAPTAATDQNGIIINNTLSEINLEFADATHNGIVSTTSQTFTGTKTFATAVDTPIITSVGGGVITIASGASQYPIGTGALTAVTSGTGLIAIGTDALAADTTGSRNIGIGSNALAAITTNNDSTAVGYNALAVNTSSGLTAFGSGALAANTSGTGNVALGYQSLNANTTGYQNTAVGYQALDLNTTGTNNSAFGYQALKNNTGFDNTAMGVNALLNNTSGTDNTAVGINALYANTTDSQLVAIGSGALQKYNNTSGQHVAIGYQALNANNNGSNGNGNVAVGWQALQVDHSPGANTAVGSSAMQSNTTGHYNTAVGNNAAYSNTTGVDNTAIGQFALYNNITNSDNTAVGRSALYSSTADQLTAVGSAALALNTTGVQNVAMGFQSLLNNTTGNNNTAHGYQTLQYNQTGNDNTALGYNALNQNASASQNTAVGSGALSGNDLGTGNNAIGYQALTANTTGSGNTASGFQSLSLITTGTNNIAVGSLAGSALTSANSSNIDIGNVGVAGDNGTIRIGTAGTHTTNFQAGIYNVNPGTSLPVVISSTGQLGTGTGEGTSYTAVAPTAATDDNGIIINNTLSEINLEFADATHNGIVSTTSQTFTGTKTFATAINTPIITSVSGGVIAIASGASQYPIGTGALVAVTSGANLIAIGTDALAADTSGSRNIGIGSNALAAITTNNDSTAVGYNALAANTSAGLTAVGSGALSANSTGLGNVALGYQALAANSTANFNTAVGYQALLDNTTGADNTAIGFLAMQSNTTGSSNTAVGIQSLQLNVSGVQNAALGTFALTNNTGNNNTGLGYQALTANTSGAQNTAVGSEALAANTTGGNNTAHGYAALIANTTGGNNTAIGYDTLLTNTIGNDNTAVGYNALNAATVNQLTAVGSGALQANTTGVGNAALGFQALLSNTLGNVNTAVGYQALLDNTTGSDNIAIGYLAMQSNTTGGSNTAVGNQALQLNVSGVQNAALGTFALTNNTGNNNTGLGYQALTANTSGTQNTAVGSEALAANTGNYNTATGSSALIANTSGAQNTAHGVNTLSTNTTGADNTAVGFNALHAATVNQLTAVGSGALQANTTGVGNAALGYQALLSNTLGNVNTAVGYQALLDNTSGNDNTAVGYLALESNTTGSDNTALGYQALLHNTSSQITAVGSGALQANTSGTNNSALGYNALTANTTGSQNTAMGWWTLKTNTTGSNNVAVGYATLDNLASGTNNVAIGGLAGSNLTGSETNNIYINHAGVTSENNAIRIGTSTFQTACYIQGIYGVTSSGGSAVFINSSGQLGTSSSSIRYKENVQDINEESSAILDFRPVSFSYKSDETHTKQYGLIAEEVNKVMPALVLRNGQGEIETVKYHELATLLLNELIKQHAVIEKQNDELNKQRVTLEEQDSLIQSVSARLTALESAVA